MLSLDNESVYKMEAASTKGFSCPLGEISLLFDGEPVDFALYAKLPVSDYEQEHPVDANKRIRWKFVPDGAAHILSCQLTPKYLHYWDFANDERLEAIEVDDGSSVLAIGTEWDFFEYDYYQGKGAEDYRVRGVEDALQFLFDESTAEHDIIIGVSWISEYTEKTRYNPEFVCDPGIDKLSVGD